MKQIVEAVAQRIAARNTSFWVGVTSLKRFWKTTASRKPNRTCTPAVATRVSCSNSESCRVRRSCSFSTSCDGVWGDSSPMAAIQSVVGLARRRAQAGERLADDPRHLHLRDADPLADLGLGEVLLEAQPQHLALALGHRVEQTGEGGAIFRQPEAVLVATHRVAQRVARLLARSARRVDRRRPVGRRRLERLEDLLLVGLDGLGDLPDRRRAVQAARELGHSAIDLERELLKVAGHPDRPRAVAEVALELAEDRGN